MADTLKIEDKEAQVLSKYLVGEECPTEIAVRYEEAVNKLNAVLSRQEQQIWDRMLSSRLYLKLIDSGLAITSPQSALRKRIFIMLAILEASPEYTLYFLPQKRSVFYIIPLGFKAALSAVYLLAGTLLVKLSKVS
jgi:hypothetical protein